MPVLHVVSERELTFNGRTYHCAIGEHGFTESKQEGDKCTPLGEFALRECWYRADRVDRPETILPTRAIAKTDGWCDDPADAHYYNKHVTLPYDASHEKLWREDHAYDLIVPLGYNDDPPELGKGSAIFMHVAKPRYKPTEGCIALSRADLLEILAEIGVETRMRIMPEA